MGPILVERSRMKKPSRTTLAATGAVLAIGAGAGGALAASTHGPGRGGPPGAAAVASYLGLTPAELRSRLASGTSLAQIAAAQGKSVSGLEDVIYEAARTRLDKAVAAGRLSADREQTALAALKSHLDDIVNRVGPPLGGPGSHRGGPGAGLRAIGGAAADYLGLTRAELRAQLRSGKSLAQIAVAQGKTVAGLKTAILAAARAHLDKAVTAGRLTAAQAKTRLDALESHLDDIVNRTGPPGPPAPPGP
jgi:hypothetical protein